MIKKNLDPKPKFLNPRKNPKTRNLTQAKSKKPKPDPRGEGLTRPIPIFYVIVQNNYTFFAPFLNFFRAL